MSGDGAATILRVVASLVVVLVLALIAARLAKRAGVRGEGAGLRVVDRVGLTRETAVAVVEVGGRVLVLGTGATGVSLLAELDPAEVALARRSGRPEPGKVTVTRVVAPGAGPPAPTVPSPTVAGQRAAPPGPRAAVPVQRPAARPQAAAPRGSGAALDPRTWRQGLDALRELTVRRG